MFSHSLLIILALEWTSLSYGNGEIYNIENDLLQLDTSSDNEDIQETKNDDLLVELIENNGFICNNIIENSCLTAKILRSFECNNTNFIPIQQLCNGEPNCEDNSDEVNCYVNLMDKVTTARNVIANTIASVDRKCLPKDVNYLLTEEMKFHREVLASPTKLITTLQDLKTQESASYMNASSDISFIISSIATTLDTMVCKLEDEHLAEPELNVNDQEARYSYSCEDTRPSKETDCVYEIGPCKHLCLKRYELKSYKCPARYGGSSVTLDEICNGNLNCLDERDETYCVAGITKKAKLATMNYYDVVLNTIANQPYRTNELDYGLQQYNWLVLYDLVKSMKEMTTTVVVDSQAVKRRRDAIFDMLGDIYQTNLQTHSETNVEATFNILMSIKTNLVEAMKRSATGNKLSFSYETCSCKNGNCTLTHCSRKCLKICLIEPKLMRFSCSDNTKSVPLNEVCNGNNDCIYDDGDDEKNCMTETTCRPRHFAMLRQELTELENSCEEKSLCELLEAWKTKATQALLDGERQHNLTHAIFEQRIRLLLDMLLQVYASMEDHKGSHDTYVLNEFEKVAKIVKKALKLCRK